MKIRWSDKDVVSKLIEGRESIVDILRSAGIKPGSDNPKTLKKWVAFHGLQLPIYKRKGKPPTTGQYKRTHSDAEMFCTNSHVDFCSVKSRIRKDNLIPYKCSICNNIGEWNYLPLVLHLDHIDGNRRNNNLKNLRYLCPNCHSQTETYSNKKRNKSETKRELNKRRTHPRRRKFEITKEELEVMVWEKSTVQVAKDLGVSDKAIEKRCKLLGISKPERGYWSKVNKT